MNKKIFSRGFLLFMGVMGLLFASAVTAEPIRHDAEHYILLHQYQEQWAAEDQETVPRPLEVNTSFLPN